MNPLVATGKFGRFLQVFVFVFDFEFEFKVVSNSRSIISIVLVVPLYPLPMPTSNFEKPGTLVELRFNLFETKI